MVGGTNKLSRFFIFLFFGQSPVSYLLIVLAFFNVPIGKVDEYNTSNLAPIGGGAKSSSSVHLTKQIQPFFLIRCVYNLQRIVQR